MATNIRRLEKKCLDTPDETRTFPNGKLQVVRIDNVTVGRATFEPGWQWSKDVKPIAGTASCQATHTGYQISGRLMVKMDDGTVLELGPGDAFVIPSGHDGWVVGDEPVVSIDFTGVTEFAKPR
jgi:quercetin dioxygenase-like cupin family protein